MPLATRAWNRVTRSTTSAVRRAVWTLTRTPVVHILHIGKTGGTALQHAIRTSAPARAYGVILESHDTRLGDVPRGEKVVFVLRDPVDRFVSGFYSRQRQGRPRYSSPWRPAEAELFDRFATPDALGCALASALASDRLAAERGMRALTLVDSYWRWFGDEQAFRSRLDDVLFVGRQERLSADFEQLRRILGLSADATLPSSDVLAHRNAPDLDRRLSDIAVEALREWYRSDYAFIRLCETAAGLSPLR